MAATIHEPATPPKIWISNNGFPDAEQSTPAIFLAWKATNWGPEQDGVAWRNYALQRSFDGTRFEVQVPSELLFGTEFKLVIPDCDLSVAYEIYFRRLNVGVHVGLRFDYDKTHRAFWLLAESHRDHVARPGHWDQNNILPAGE